MKLAKYHKDAIVRAVFNDVKRRPDEEIVKEIQDKLYKEMGKEARALYRKHPKALAKVHLGGFGTKSAYSFVVGDLNVDKIWAVLDPYRKVAKEVENSKALLIKALGSINTRKQLVDSFPELVPYLPKDCESDSKSNITVWKQPEKVIEALVAVGWEQKVFRNKV